MRSALPIGSGSANLADRAGDYGRAISCLSQNLMIVPMIGPWMVMSHLKALAFPSL
jgi:hypothetical protein